MRRTTIWFCLALATAGAPGVADEWMSAEPLAAVSANGRWEVHTVLGSADAFRPQAGDRSRFARAVLRDRARGDETSFALDHPVSPVEILLLDDGSLLTFDQWHNLGFQSVVVRYARSGRRLWARTLEELLSAEQIRRVPESVSSRHWRRRPLEVRIEAEAIALTLWNEDRLRISIDDGSASYQPIADLGDDAARLLIRGEALRTAAAHVESIRVLRRALEIDPHLIEGYRQLAWTYQAIDDPAQAVVVLEVGVREHPAAPESAAEGEWSSDPRLWLLHELARALERAKRPVDAEARYREVLRLHPRYWNAAEELARMWRLQGRELEADRLLEELRASLPDRQ